jgi:WD40 repeat protein
MANAFTVDYPGRIDLLCFSPGGTRLALAQRRREGQGGKAILVVEVPSGREVARYTDLDGLRDAAFRSEEEIFLLHGGECLLCGLKKKPRRALWEGDATKLGGIPFNASVSPDGNTIALGTDGALILVDVARKRVRHSLPTPLKGGVRASAFSADGRLVAAVLSSPITGISFGMAWDVRQGTRVRLLKLDVTSTDAVALRPDGRRLAVDADSGVLVFGMDDPILQSGDLDLTPGRFSEEWNLLYGIGWTKPLAVLSAGAGVITSLSFSATGRDIRVVGHGGKAVRLSARGGGVRSLQQPPDGQELGAAAVSAGGTAAGAAENNAILLWDVPGW